MLMVGAVADEIEQPLLYKNMSLLTIPEPTTKV